MRTSNKYIKISILLLFLFSLQIIFFTNSAMCQSRSYEEYRTEIRYLWDSGQFKKGIGVIKEMLSYYPEKRQLWLPILSGYYTELRDLKSAAEVLEEYLQSFPNDYKMKRLLAMNYGEQGLHDKAIPLLKECLTFNPNDAIIRYEYSMSLEEKGLYKEAEKQCRLYLDLKSDDYKGWWLFGNIMLKEKRYEDAVNAYEKALQLRPKTYDVIHGLGIAYYRNGNYGSAIKYFLQLPGRRIKLFLFLFFLLIPLVGLISYFKDIIGKKLLTQKWTMGVSIFFVISVFLLIRHAGRFLYGKPFPFPYKIFDISIIFCEAILLYFLFRLKNWARFGYLIYWFVFSILVIVYAFINMNVFRQRGLYTQFATFLPAIYSLAFLYYFTRPKVREMFK